MCIYITKLEHIPILENSKQICLNCFRVIECIYSLDIIFIFQNALPTCERNRDNHQDG